MASLPEKDRVLYLPLEGRDPDDGVTLVPYEKGALLLRTIEREVGRERFDAFLRAYFDYFAFQSITTAQWLDYIRRELPTSVPLEDWLYQPGIPQGAADPQSDALSRIAAAAAEWQQGKPIETARWTTQEWLHFLRLLETPDLPRLDREFHFGESGNSEIQQQWLLMSIRSGYEPAFSALERFLCSVGRRKFLKPLYTELLKTAEGRERAKRIYQQARPGYHPIAQITIDALIG
jgi:hypothetical protein